MNPAVSFAAGVQGLQKVIRDKGYAVDDFLQLMHGRLILQDLPVPQRIRLTYLLANIDYRLKQGCSEHVQLAAIVAAFHEARAMPIS